MTKKILAVDDSPSVRKLMESSLSRGGFSVITAEDGQQAAEMIARNFFDAVITDVNMPRMDGFELLKRIRSDESLAHLPVVMLFSEDSQTNSERAAKLGATACLVKSFKPSTLLDLINQLVSNSK